MEHTKIYYLHYGDNIPFYVGKTNKYYWRIYSHRKKYGKNTIMEIIDEVPINEWKFWEKHYISLFKSWGFNLSNKNEGGGGANHPVFTIERNKKIGDANKGLLKSHKGKKFTEEHKNNIKATRGFLKGRKNTWQSKPILQFDLEGNFIKEWSSQSEASDYISNGKNSRGISACCKKNQKSSYGYIWKFKE
jgi:hypothetical protein